MFRGMPVWGGRAVIAFHLAVFAVPVARGHDELPVVRANFKSVTIRDGPVVPKDGWTVDPDRPVGVSDAFRSAAEKGITGGEWA